MTVAGATAVVELTFALRREAIKSFTEGGASFSGRAMLGG
jgi:hypothetical protein